MKAFALVAVVTLLASGNVRAQEKPEWPELLAVDKPVAFPGTELLTDDSDFASVILDGAGEMVLQKIEESRATRKPERDRFREILGLTRDDLAEGSRLEFLDTVPGPRAEADSFLVYRVRWRAFRDVWGYGLLLEPKKEPVAGAIVIPDADVTPEEFVGIPATEGGKADTPPAVLASAGVRVVVPSLINRLENRYRITQREFLHRSAYELGRTLIGYELQKVIALTGILSENNLPVGIAGVGEGGRLALYAGAVDERHNAVLVSGYFAPREKVWREPADRTVFGLLNGFGDAELVQLSGSEKTIVEFGAYPEFVFRGDDNGDLALSPEKADKAGKPGKLLTPTREEFQAEIGRIPDPPEVMEGERLLGPEAVQALVNRLGISPPVNTEPGSWVRMEPGPDPDPERQERQVDEIDRHNQWALIDSRVQRTEFFADLKTESIQDFEKTIEPYREIFREEVIGSFADERVPVQARTRSYQSGEGVISYEVVMDVFPGLIAYGVLTIPENLPLDGSEKRPVVVCQHGLEGRPQQVIGEEKFAAYSAFATRLAQEGYVTFAPQNLYLFHDRFRMLQFQANSIGKTLFSFIVPQHEQILDWLESQAFVDPDRIAFYGLSYGGKSAMRIPALVDRYCLSICSADFNEWIWKNVATDTASLRYSYANKREYEMYEFNLGNTFNYAEMAALICPRPFMVERGHFDGVAPDEWVAFEYAKVRNLYAARLGMPERTTIEWFPGPHKINGVETYRFLDRWLRSGNP